MERLEQTAQEVYVCEIVRSRQGWFDVGPVKYMPTWPRGNPSTSRKVMKMVRTGIGVISDYYNESGKTPKKAKVTMYGEDELTVVFAIPRS